MSASFYDEILNPRTSQAFEKIIILSTILDAHTVYDSTTGLIDEGWSWDDGVGLANGTVGLAGDAAAASVLLPALSNSPNVQFVAKRAGPVGLGIAVVDIGIDVHEGIGIRNDINDLLANCPTYQDEIEMSNAINYSLFESAFRFFLWGEIPGDERSRKYHSSYN